MKDMHVAHETLRRELERAVRHSARLLALQREVAALRTQVRLIEQTRLPAAVS